MPFTIFEDSPAKKQIAESTSNATRAARLGSSGESPAKMHGSRRSGSRAASESRPAGDSGGSAIRVVEVNLWHNTKHHTCTHRADAATRHNSASAVARRPTRARHEMIERPNFRNDQDNGRRLARKTVTVESTASKYRRLYAAKCEEHAECQRQLAHAEMEAGQLRNSLQKQADALRKHVTAIDAQSSELRAQYDEKCRRERHAQLALQAAAEEAAGLRASLLRAADESAVLQSTVVSLQLQVIGLHQQILEEQHEYELAAAKTKADVAELQTKLHNQMDVVKTVEEAKHAAQLAAATQAGAAERAAAGDRAEAKRATAEIEQLRLALGQAEDEAVEFEEIAIELEKRLRQSEEDKKALFGKFEKMVAELHQQLAQTETAKSAVEEQLDLALRPPGIGMSLEKASVGTQTGTGQRSNANDDSVQENIGRMNRQAGGKTDKAEAGSSADQHSNSTELEVDWDDFGEPWLISTPRSTSHDSRVRLSKSSRLRTSSLELSSDYTMTHQLAEVDYQAPPVENLCASQKQSRTVRRSQEKDFDPTSMGRGWERDDY